MYRLITHLDKLLALHDCVIVPSLGAVIKEYVPAHYASDEHRVYPMEERFHFNGELRERDGLLDDIYSKSYRISIRRARNLVDTDVEELRRDMIRLGSVSVGHLGRLHIDRNGKMDFLPEQSQLPLGYGEAYGLTSYALPYRGAWALSALNTDTVEKPTELQGIASSHREQPTDAQDARYLHVRIYRPLMGWMAAAAIVLICLLPITSTPIRDYFSAGFVPSENQRISTLETEEIETRGALQDSLPTESISSSDQVESIEAQSVEALGSYYVVIGSFRSEAKINEYLQSHRTSSFSATMGSVKKGRNRLIYAKRFVEKRDAEKYLLALQAESDEYAQAWLLHYNNQP